jgi:biotin operon repressor
VQQLEVGGGTTAARAVGGLMTLAGGLAGLEPNLETRLLVRDEAARALALLARLRPKERQALAMHYGLAGEAALTLPEIAATFEVSRSRVWQVAAKGLRRLRAWANYLHLRPQRQAPGLAGGFPPFAAGWPEAPSRSVP